LAYGYPALGRYGLTHGLLAWARCALWCEQTGAEALAPIWLRPRVGPYLRRERDKRNYFKLFRAGPATSGLRRTRLLATAPRTDIGEGWPEGPVDAGTLVVFRNALANNEIKCFSQVAGHGALLKSKLIEITRPRFVPDPPAAPHIAIHIRLGDFAPPPADLTQVAGRNNMQLPMDWYVDRLRVLRAAIGRDVPVIVYSDGDDAALAPVLSERGVIRSPRQASVTDLLAMSNASALIASGSGFSLWGAFLGNVPRISFRGQSIVPIHADPTHEVETMAGEALPDTFTSIVRLRLGD
jgi:hypothetical protein